MDKKGIIQEHSKIKLELYRLYLERYVSIPQLTKWLVTSIIFAEPVSAIQRIFAVVCFGELARDPLMPPDLSSGALRAPDKKVVPLFEVSINCILRSFCGRVIAVVNDSFSHATEDRLDYVEELRTSGQGRRRHDGETVLDCLLVNLIQMCEQLL